MPRQSKSISFAEIFECVDNEFSTILKKCSNGYALDLLQVEEFERLKDCLLSIIKQSNLEQSDETSNQKLKYSMELVLCILNNSINIQMKTELINIIKYINSDELLTNDPQIINGISKVNEYWMTKMQVPEEIHGMEYLTIKNLLNLCTSDKPLMSHLQRLSAIRKSITEGPFDKAVPSLRPLLIKVVQKVQVLGSEYGQRFLAQAFVLSQKILMEIHKTIMLELSSCNKKKAMNYGKVYILAWHVASESMRRVLEKSCFQHVMESMMKEQRTSLELNKSSQNMLTVLEMWHSERKKKNPDFITMITNAYQPILWKYLESGFNVHRCNATDVLFKAFPLQRANDNAADAESLFNKQFDAMLASLTDDCHIIRIIGIREVCNILSLYWNSFTPVQIQSLMSVLTKQNANDASSAEVRRMVYIGFQNLVKSPLSREYVRQILPNLANNIHDINQKVRIVFIQLLICIKELKDANFKYSEIVSMFNIQYRLAEDSIAVGQWIVELLMRNFYHSKMSVIEWTKRFIYLIKTYRTSYRNFFFYSSRSLPFADACTIIYEILSQIGKFVIEKFKMDLESNESNFDKPRVKKKGNKKIPTSEWNGSRISSTSSASSENGIKEPRKCAFDDADVVSGLFDIVTILWVLHDAKLTKPENEEIRFKLYDTYIKYAQPLINYYKDCNLFLSVITLSGNIPSSLLRNNGITLPGYCIKMLKSIEIDRSNEENEKIISMLIALVKWGRGNEIIEQIRLWLDAAFETKDMNETILPRRRVKINEGIQPNSIIAINVLDTLLKKEYIKLCILEKNYCELFSLWKFMSRIRRLIETRIAQGEPFDEELVSDEFINLCFRRYIKLIPLLKEDERVEEEMENRSHISNDTDKMVINRQKEMENIVEWGENFLYPLLQEEDLRVDDAKLITTALEDILFVADNMIIVHMVNNLFHLKIGHFVLKLLGTKQGIFFIKAASRITVALNFSAKLLFKVQDDLQIFSTVIPSLLSHTLDVLSNSSQLSEKLQEDMPTIKTCFGKILATYHDNLSSKSSLKENARQLNLVVSFFFDCLVNIISREIPREDSTVLLYSSPSQLPPVASSLFSLFHGRKIWTPLSLHIITTKLSERSLKTTMSCILLLNLYAVSDKKASQAHLRKALSSAVKNLTKIKESLAVKEMEVDYFSEEGTETSTRKTWPSNVATRGCNSTGLGQKFDVGEGSSKVEVANDNEIEENQRGDEKSENIQSFQCDGNNLEM